MEIIESSKGGLKLCYSGYMYTKQWSRGETVRWRCVKRTLSCKGALTTSLQNENPTLLTEHNHDGDESAIEAAKCKSRMKTLAKTTRDKPGQIYAQTALTMRTQAQAHFVSQEHCKRLIRHHQSANQPRDPASLQELVISGEWASTGGPEPQPFLIYDNGQDSNNRIIVFASEQTLRHLAKSDIWMMDGNFAMAPPKFTQLYVIRVPLGNTAVSVVYAFLQHKTQNTYEQLFTAVLEKCAEYHLYPDPRTVMLDFEQAALQAITAILGSEVTIRCCFYHLTQSSWRKIQELGLATVYKENEDIKLFRAMVDSLAFLPLEDVSAGMNYLKQNTPEGMEPFVTYFDQTYVTGTYRRVQRQQDDNEIPRVQLRLIPPRFPPEIWNVHEATIRDESRTNNLCEGWNNRYSRLVKFMEMFVTRYFILYSSHFIIILKRCASRCFCFCFLLEL